MDCRQSFVLKQIRRIDPEAHIYWLIRSPFHTVRSFIDTRHLELDSTSYYPIPQFGSPAQRGARLWLNVNETILRDIGDRYTVVPTESLYRWDGKTKDVHRTELTFAQHTQIEKIAGEFWEALWMRFPEIQRVA